MFPLELQQGSWASSQVVAETCFREFSFELLQGGQASFRVLEGTQDSF